MNEMSEQSNQDMWNHIHKQREAFNEIEVDRQKRKKEQERGTTSHTKSRFHSQSNPEGYAEMVKDTMKLFTDNEQKNK